MKTILLFIALISFTAIGGSAQDKRCPDKHKAVSKKMVQKEPVPTCFMLKKENLDIPGCMDVTYSGNNAYLGYSFKTTTHKIPKPNMAAVAAKPVEPQKPLFKKVNDEPVMPCYTHRQHNIVVKECPGDFYDNEKWPFTSAGILEYNTEHTYMGNYPTDKEAREIKDPGKMENRPIEGARNFQGNDDLCLWDCPKK
ncbi:MAG: hypothetical protein ACHQD8_03915 [Chitinophagales bacterium]